MSELIMAKKENLGFVPEVVGYLASIKEPDYIYTDYKVRHPGAVYNLVTHYLVNDFIELLKELETNQIAFDETKKSGVERKFQILIGDFFKFHDSCYEVIVGCCKRHTPPSEKDFYRDWLKKNGYKTGTEFGNKTVKTLEELDLFRKINNKLKHTSMRLVR
jgi:hypothetical protein